MAGFDYSSSASSGALSVLARTVVGVGGAANVDFTDIDQTYETLVIVLHGRGTNASSSSNVHVRFNNDSAGNYDNQMLYGLGATAATFASVAATAGVLGGITAANATAGRPGTVRAEIPGYARNVFNKTAVATGGRQEGTTTGDAATQLATCTWRSTAAITRVTLYPAAGNFAEGTVVTLYGLASDPT